MSDGDVVPEEQLLAEARRGDEAAFELLVERHRGELYAHCYRMLERPSSSECPSVLSRLSWRRWEQMGAVHWWTRS